MTTAAAAGFVDFATHPDRYRHWQLAIDGRVATVQLNVDENATIRPGYRLKLNSYDLSVDIELHDVLQRIRFEHPTVASVIITGEAGRSFCAGANIYMLGLSSHGWKVNFCKFTNETRNGMEDSSEHDGLHFIAAVNGACAGGGYELALACDEIVLVDDRSTAVSLPEVPLLGVLPGTGGLTRLVDKRRVRRDIADLFCTSAEGVKARRALEWGLVDAIAPPSEFAAAVRARAEALAAESVRPSEANGVVLHELERTVDERGLHYRYVDVTFDREFGTATLLVRAPEDEPPSDIGAIVAAGDRWWPLLMARELDDALLTLRTNEPDLGLLLLRSAGNAEHVVHADASMAAFGEHWFVRETAGMLRRTLARLDVTSRSMYALIDRDSAFAGTLFEVVLAADRSYMLAPDEDAPEIVLTQQNFGAYPTVGNRSRLATRFNDDDAHVDSLRAKIGEPFGTEEALEAGLVTAGPDDLDWDDEVRLAIEERVALSPDALSGLEANLRFPGPETLRSKIFGRLSAWQNWIFIRPNATGPQGALKVYGSGSKPRFDQERV